MDDWTVWASFLTLGTAAAIMAAYFLCRARFEQMQGRMLVLEREVAMARLREEANEKKVLKILEAVTELRKSTDDHLRRLRERLDELRAEGYPREHVDAA
jgi:vacuolar-type H+-ATPase subunit I/STV1